MNRRKNENIHKTVLCEPVILKIKKNAGYFDGIKLITYKHNVKG